ncbi:hypothetical protein E3N88_02228 [Mikania micrantha]|uniref:PGG domain-containing protein n=1 Tax=Mikania micrantha TaxID=192012 RepID=A0A5N6Q3F0_9ASTR|nr:hypothetical protein E3N88_02228 [Mikania micrantha]
MDCAYIKHGKQVHKVSSSVFSCQTPHIHRFNHSTATTISSLTTAILCHRFFHQINISRGGCEEGDARYVVVATVKTVGGGCVVQFWLIFDVDRYIKGVMQLPPGPPQQPLPPPQQPPPPQPQQNRPPPQPQQNPPPQQPPPPPQPLQNPPPLPWPQRHGPNLPNMALVHGSSREEYLQFGVALYEASINYNWKAAKAILDKNKDLVRYSITENGETALHIAASARGDSKRVEEFVKKMVEMMGEKDLELQNKNYNTALYLAAVTGNVETVKIMVKENKKLLTIPGANRTMLPLYAAALFGNKDVVDYIYEESRILADEDGWSRDSRGWLIEKLLENDMFDTTLRIVKKYPLHDGTIKALLKLLAGKPEAFHETNKYHQYISHLLLLVLACGCFKRASTKKSNALSLLRHIWNDVVKRPTKEIDAILRGPPDSSSIDQDSKVVAGWTVTAMKLQKVIHEHVENMTLETNRLISSVGPSKALKLQDLISQSLMRMHAATQNITKDSSDLNMQDNKPVSPKERLVLQLQKLIFKYIAGLYDKTMRIISTSGYLTEDQLVQELQKGIVELNKKLQKEAEEQVKKYDRETYSSRVVFIAAEVGNTNFLVELIRGYPDLIWKVNDNNLSIFHVAVKHRHAGIYSLLYEIGTMKHLITPLRDPDDNNMLHLVGTCANQNQLADVSGVALQMQRELSWFLEVMQMVPPAYILRKNKDGLTPHELFTKEHKELVTQGEKWMKETSSQCIVVGALIATIVFAATFTVPGGYNQNNGIPFFRSKATFVVFVLADAISLILSSASILLFLSILTSRYDERDFLESLSLKLLFGLATLFLSIATMLIAFGVSFLPLYKNGLLWIPIIICVLVAFPAILYRLPYLTPSTRPLRQQLQSSNQK